jgi:hypothetical protein
MRAWLPFGVLFTTPVSFSVPNCRLPLVAFWRFPLNVTAGRSSVFFHETKCKPCWTQPISRGPGVAIVFCSYFCTMLAPAFLKSSPLACATFNLATVARSTFTAKGASPNTTHLYIEADLEMKRRTLETLQSPKARRPIAGRDDALMRFLMNL